MPNSCLPIFDQLVSSTNHIHMALNSDCSKLVFFIIIFLESGAIVNAKNITLVNQCKESIWPGIITHGDSYNGEGYVLKPGQSVVYNASDGWSGRIWARTGCNFESKASGSTCQTGDCGPSINCTNPGSRPATIAEFTLGRTDFYDVSLVDGFNVGIVIKPGGGAGNCSTAGCDGDLKQSCPSELAVNASSSGKVIACKSACDAFNTDEYCCRGAYSDLATCMPSNYSKSFKQVCPAASSYALDDRTSIITCSTSDYMVAFCATRNQTVCSYGDQKFVCNSTTPTSHGSKALSHLSLSWGSLMLAFVSISQALF